MTSGVKWILIILLFKRK